LAIIFLFTSLDSLGDLKEYAFQLIIAIVVFASIVYQVFRKKGKLHTNKIEIATDYLFINNLKVPTNNITLDIYTVNNNFNRYHFWDSKGIFSIFSVVEDDLLNSFKNSYPENTNTYEEISSTMDGSSVSIGSTSVHLNYDLESGAFSKQKIDEPVSKTIPDFFIYDPNYKQGKPFPKK
jgi:hypothetical protein